MVFKWTKSLYSDKDGHLNPRSRLFCWDAEVLRLQHHYSTGSRGRGHVIFYSQNAIFLIFFILLLRSRLILNIILIEIWPKTRKKWLFLQPLTLSIIFYPPPPPRSNPGAAAEHLPKIVLFDALIIKEMCDICRVLQDILNKTRSQIWIYNH